MRYNISGTVYLSGSTLSVISSTGIITINNFSNKQLGISLSEKETIDKKNVERDVFLQEDFCSPLILDINNNGTSSTGLGNSQTYFDMDGDGFKERTAWVEQGDGLLVLDRNGNGSIDNGTELFGNFTPLSSGNSANDGFEALLQYNSAVEFVQQALAMGIDKSNLTLTGHSLGGILTQQVGASLGIQGYAYNPWGANALTKYPPNGTLNIVARVLEAVGVYSSSTEAFAKDNIANISYQDGGDLNGDFLSNLATGLVSEHLGDAFIPVWGADVGADGHRMPVLNSAIAHYNTVLTHFSNSSYKELSQAYLSKGSFEKTEAIFNDLGLYQASGLKFNFLTDDSALYIATQAKSDTNWFNPDNRIESFSFSNGTTWDANMILAHQGTDEADITKLSNNNTFKQNIFTYTSKRDTINNCFYIFNKKAA